MKTKKWLGTQFVSSSSKTEQFLAFAKDFKSDIRKQIKDVGSVSFNVGHFYISGFIKLNVGAYVYFIVSDVRFFTNEWYNKVLIRTAESERDFTGGINKYVPLTQLAQAVQDIYQ